MIYLYNSIAEDTIEHITSFLSGNDIGYKEEFSGGHWVVNIKISKEKGNIDRLKEALE